VFLITKIFVNSHDRQLLDGRVIKVKAHYRKSESKRKSSRKPYNVDLISHQSTKRSEGNKVEKMVKQDILKKLSEEYKISINSLEGVDLYIKNGHIYNVEVKSAREKQYEKRKKDGQTYLGTRTGRFVLKKQDADHSDFFAFAVKKVDENLKWNQNIKIYYVDSKIVRDYLMKKFLYGKDNVKISINDVKKFPEFDILQVK